MTNLIRSTQHGGKQRFIFTALFNRQQMQSKSCRVVSYYIDRKGEVIQSAMNALILKDRPRHQQLYIPKVVFETRFTHSKRPAIKS